MRPQEAVYALRSKLARVECILDREGMALMRSAMVAAGVGQPGILCRFVAHRGACVGEGLGVKINHALAQWLSKVRPGFTTLHRAEMEERMLTREEWLAIMAFATFNGKHAPYEVW